MTRSTMMGAVVKRKEDPRLITGRGQYTGDIRLTGMLCVALVRSPYAHAVIGNIDTSAAASAPGVFAVFTGADIANLTGPLPVGVSGEGTPTTNPKSRARTHSVLSVGKVRHVGEAVCAVIAESEAAAADAAALVIVDWQPLPAASTIEAALAPGAALLFDDMQSNVDHTWTKQAGDVDAAFANAHTAVTLAMNNQRVAGVPLEGRAVVAAPDPLTDGLTVWTSTQAAHWVRRDLAKTLKLPESLIRVIAPDVGGGFGVKISTYPEEILLAALARHTGRPLRWAENRMEGLQSTTHGRSQLAEYQAAVTAEGKVTALRIKISAEVGGYPVDPGVADITGEMAIGVYDIPAVDIQIQAVFTTTTPIAAYRGAGRPEAAYYIERLMDQVAAKIGLDPAEVRRRNFIPPEAFPYRTITGALYDSGEYARALDKVLTISSYADLRAEQARRLAAKEPLIGIGLATYVEVCGFGPYDSAAVRVEPSGAVSVATGISPHGQGTGNTFAQIVHDQLGAEFDDVVVRWGDTAVTLQGNGTMGSRSLAVGGGALVRAVEKVRNKARAIAAHMLEANVEDVELTDGNYQIRGVPDRALTLAEIAKRAYTDDLPPELDSGLEATDFFRPPELIYPFGAHVAVVEVEPETGEVKVIAYYTVDDCGPRISPTLVTGQVHGGLAQGIGQALFEAVVYDENGQLLSGSLMDYALPRAEAFPNFVTDSTVTPTPHNPLGVKGIGEAATIGSTPAIVNAVVDALRPLGVQALDMPVRSERVWRAIRGVE